MVYLWFTYGLPMVYLCFTYALPMVYLWFIMILPTCHGAFLDLENDNLSLFPLPQVGCLSNPRTTVSPHFSTLEDLTPSPATGGSHVSQSQTLTTGLSTSVAGSKQLPTVYGSPKINATRMLFLMGHLFGSEVPMVKNPRINVFLNLAFWEESKFS